MLPSIMYHQPVLLQEAVDALRIKPNGVYVDVTFGGGGHSREILKRLEGGKLIAFDRDPDAAANIPDDPRFELVPQNFSSVRNWLIHFGHHQVDGILADLGVSSHQFDEATRGFSIRFDGPLDMRMDKTQELHAGEIVNEYGANELATLLREFGEVQHAGRVARAIVAARPIASLAVFNEILMPFAERAREHKFLAQVYQAIRIVVNDELNALTEFLRQIPEILVPGGRLVVISYHSLEDRMVKNFIKTGHFSGTPEKDFFGNLIRPLNPLTSKPMVPTETEINTNPRARSARMRTAERNP